MLANTLALSLLFLPGAVLAQPGPAAAKPVDASELAGRDDDGMPSRGSPADLALWSSMRDDQNQVFAEWAVATRLFHQSKSGRREATLASLAREKPELAPRAEALRARLLAARQGGWQVLTSTWPVDPRLGCRAEMQNLAGVMEGLPGQPAAVGLDAAREEARACQAKERPALALLAKMNRDLASALSDVDGFLEKPAVANEPVASSAGPGRWKP